jgi:DNA-binding response OmpR family regulator
MAYRILVVDDDPDCLALIKTALLFQGFEVATAKDGFEATAMAGKYLPDLIILDVMMPKMDGFRVCRNLRQMKEFKTTPIVFLTAKDTPGDAEWGKKMGGSRYLTKPLDMRVLLEAVRDCLTPDADEKDRPQLDQIRRDARFEG